MKDSCKPVVFNLSGILEHQDFWKTENAVILDLKDLQECCFFCGETAKERLRKEISVLPEEGIHFIDSGDYHYITLFFLERIKEPFILIQADHHSDCRDSAFGEDLLSCGSWVAEAMRTLPLMKKVFFVGAGGEDGVREELNGSPRACFIPESRAEDFAEALPEEERKLPVYLSVDKDVLAQEDAATDWSQGQLRLDSLIKMLRSVFERFTVIGLDVCGEPSKEQAESRSSVCRRNSEANRRILAEWMRRKGE